MSTVLTRPRDVAARSTAADVSTAQAAVAIDRRPSSAGFAALLGAYRDGGGTARGDDLARLLADRQRGDYVSLARAITGGEAFGFEWRQTLWIPMFQFDSRDLSVKQGLRQVLSELPADFDNWSLAAWFANANAWLGNHRPVDRLDHDLPSVLAAARASGSGPSAASKHPPLEQPPIPHFARGRRTPR